MNPPMQPLIAATTAKNDSTTHGKKSTKAPTKMVPTTLAIAEAPMQHAAQQALCLESRKKASIAKPGAKIDDEREEPEVAEWQQQTDEGLRKRHH